MNTIVLTLFIAFVTVIVVQLCIRSYFRAKRTFLSDMMMAQTQDKGENE